MSEIGVDTLPIVTSHSLSVILYYMYLILVVVIIFLRIDKILKNYSLCYTVRPGTEHIHTD